MPADAKPILVFVNTKSGPQKGWKLRRKFLRLLHPLQVILTAVPQGVVVRGAGSCRCGLLFKVLTRQAQTPQQECQGRQSHEFSTIGCL